MFIVNVNVQWIFVWEVDGLKGEYRLLDFYL